MLGRQILGTLACLFAVCLVTAAPTAGAEKKLNVARLKKGDKLEYYNGREWIPAEYVDEFSSLALRVIREPFKTPVATTISALRLPQRRAKAAGAPAENPFATEEERIADRKPRTWADAGGKFKVEATFLRVDGENVVLKRTDEKEIAVPLARLSDTDRQYVEALEPSAVVEESETPSPAGLAHEKEKPAPRELPLTETNLGAADVMELIGDGWTYQPDPVLEGQGLRKVRLPLAKMNFFEKPQQILLVPAEKRAFVVTYKNFQGKQIGVQAFDVQRGTPSGSGVFSKQAAPIAASADGNWILARSQGDSFGTTAELRLYKRNGMKVTPEKAWIPYRHHGPLDEGGHEPHYPREAEVVWAEFLGSDRVISLSRVGELAVWSVADLKPFYQIKLSGDSQPALSRGGKYLAVTLTGSVAILQTSDGKLVGQLPADAATAMSALDFSLDGRKLALRTLGNRLRVWDLTTQELEREFSIPAHRGMPHSISRSGLGRRQLLAER